LKKNWTKIAAAVGPVIIIASAFWEMARMNPDYRFLVEPWAMRGTELTQGTVFMVLGVLLLIVGLVTAWEGSVSPAVSAGVVGFVVIAATVVAFVFADKDFAFTFSPVSTGLVSMLLAAGVAMALRSLFGQKHGLFKRALPLFFLTWIIIGGLMAVTLINVDVEVPTWQSIFVVFLAIGALALAIRPPNMGANRMLIVSTVAVWTTIIASAGAMRQTLIDAQVAFVYPDGTTGISASYKDTQAAGGWWLAGRGVTIAFVGAVGLWARRRDLVATIARARRQRAAAEISAKEIADAQEAYERELVEAQAAAAIPTAPPEASPEL
jgi:hypothetical protein